MTFNVRLSRPVEVLARQDGRELTEDRRTVVAYVNHGRWLANCPHCNGGIPCYQDRSGVCPDCGHVYRVGWPDERKAIEAVLELRHLAANQNWLPHETVQMLVAENVAHGDRIPVAGRTARSETAQGAR